jgi:hypothetical protein
MLSLDVSRKIIPCVYELYYKKGNPPILKLRLHKDFVEDNKNRALLELYIEHFQKEHGLGEFLLFNTGYFGFDKAIKQGEIIGEFIEYDIEIPVFRKETSEPCKKCDGTGWDNDFDDDCSLCDGCGQEIFYDWKSLNAISASLHILNMMTENFEKETSAQNPQLLTFHIFCGKGMGGYPINGAYGIDFCNWLNSLSPYRFDDAIIAMQDVYYYITKSKSVYEWNFQAHTQNIAWLIISCPGDACGTFPVNNYRWEPDQGEEFSCHNMDNPIQQIVLLVALAVLSDMARKYMEEEYK